MQLKLFIIFICVMLISFNSYAKEITIDIHKLESGKDNSNNKSARIGVIKVKDTKHGLLLTPMLKNLPEGALGFHVHAENSCANGGLAAGAHYDPKNTGKHLGPYEEGHKGDLPNLIVNKDGSATIPVLAPALKVKEIIGLSLIIHGHTDNYSDTPTLGGSGGRIACGVISKDKK